VERAGSIFTDAHYISLLSAMTMCAFQIGVKG
jgi:hypothetical protein